MTRAHFSNVAALFFRLFAVVVSLMAANMTITADAETLFATGEDSSLWTINTATTGAGTLFSFPVPGLPLTGLAFSPTGTLFATGNDSSLWTIDTTTGAGTLFSLPVPGLPLTGLAFSPTGTLFATGNDSSLWTINTTTGVGTLFSLPLPGLPLTGLAFSPTGTLFATADDGTIWTINATTGTATYFDNIGVTFSDLAFASSQTPLPAALPLFATGLGGLGLLGWRRKRKASAIAVA